MYKVTLNDIDQVFKDGITLHEKLNEKLDVGTVVFPQIQAVNIQPMDKVIIEDLTTGDKIYALVSTIKRETSGFDSPKKYNYTIGLISPTIRLQGIVLPNRKITQPLTGTKKSLLVMIQRYLKVYAPDLLISQELQELTSSVDSPEFQWNRPTLFEVLNDLLSEVDCVVTMTNFNTISYLDLNIAGDTINDDELSDVVLDQDIQNYGNKVEVELENAVYKKQNVRVIEWQSVKTDDGPILTTENGKVILDKAIGKIYKVIAKVFVNDVLGTREADITSYVVEKRQYDLSRPSDSAQYLTGDFKRNRLYYEEGGKAIDGLCYHEKLWFPTVNSPKALINVFRNAYLEKTSIDLATSLGPEMVIDFVFKVEYEALETVKLVTNKEDTQPTHKRTIMNNQDTSYVDYQAFAKKQQTLANRLAEPQLTIIGRYHSLSDVPKLGDIYEGNYKLSEREYSLYEGQVNFKGFLSKNYVLKNLRTALKRERRYTQIATGKEALESNHLTEYNFEFSKTNATKNSNLENAFLQFGEGNRAVKLVYLRHYFTGGLGVPVGLSPSFYATDNSITLAFKMYDNFSVGYSINEDFGGSRLSVKHTPYGDSNGEFNHFEFRLYTKYEIPGLNGSTFNESTYKNGLTTSRLLPVIDSNFLDQDNMIYVDWFFRYKDNAEIQAETLQFNFKEGAGIIIGRSFFENNPLFLDEFMGAYIWYSTTETYNKGDVKGKGVKAFGEIQYYRSDNAFILLGSDVIEDGVDLSTLTSWAITDDGDNIFIANNGNNDRVYLNLKADIKVWTLMSSGASVYPEQSYDYNLGTTDISEVNILFYNDGDIIMINDGVLPATYYLYKVTTIYI